MATFLPPGLLLAAALAWSGSAHAETTGCQVLDTLPATIAAPGHYCLDHDFVQDFGNQVPIQLQADDVVLDCNGHRVKHTNAANTLDAIYGPGERHDVTIRNCVLDGWYVGIFLQASSDPGARGNRIEDNQVLRSRVAGIYVIGSDNRIDRNRVAQNTADYGGSAYGIFVISMDKTGVGNVVRDNHVSDFRPTPPGTSATVEGITVSNLHDTEVSGNVISGLYNIDGQYAAGIVGYDASGTVVHDNTILTPPYPGPAPWTGYHAYGIYLPGTAEEMATNVCRDNVVGHFNTAAYGCIIVDSTGF
jgi:parallel beta-helix repeat protein